MSELGFNMNTRAGGFRFERLTVMVVDDNRHMLNLISEILRGLSIRQVIKLTDPADAFKEMLIVPVDILVVDFAMEMLNGIEFVQLVRSGKDSPDVFIPVIMVTGYSDVGTVQVARDAGVTEFLAKPISAKGLYMRILEVINHPRPFIRTPTYFGPDRRRRTLPYEGTDRRVNEASEDADAAARLYPTQFITP